MVAVVRPCCREGSVGEISKQLVRFVCFSIVWKSWEGFKVRMKLGVGGVFEDEPITVEV
jgi:hypothetical protein